jgi:hypothetical protein
MLSYSSLSSALAEERERAISEKARDARAASRAAG